MYRFLDMNRLTAPYLDALRAAADRVITDGPYIGGGEVAALESDLRALTGTAHAVGVSNGLDALRLIFRAYIELGVMAPGDEVIVPANTYVASVLAVTDCGLTPVFVEPSIDTLNLDTALIEQAITPRTRAILPVHLYGRACWDVTLADIARRYNIKIVEDNAQAIGAQAHTPGLHGSHATGALGDAAAFSFYPTKNIGALGDAGAVTTDDTELANAVRALANYGSDRRYHNIYRGYNCRLDPIQAAFIRVKLADIDNVNAGRRANAAVYNRLVCNPLITPPSVGADDTAMVWHQYTILTNHRDALRQYLDSRGVQTDIHYATPPHRQPCYAQYSSLNLPVTDRIADSIVSLPIATATPDEIAEISAIINEFKLI